jgi:hypothetical protein
MYILLFGCWSAGFIPLCLSVWLRENLEKALACKMPLIML